MVQHQVYKDATNPARALTLFSDATVHDKATNKIDRYIHPGCSTSKVELYYDFLVSKWLRARPNIQYVVSPGVNDVDNAWIAG